MRCAKTSLFAQSTFDRVLAPGLCVLLSEIGGSMDVMMSHELVVRSTCGPDVCWVTVLASGHIWVLLWNHHLCLSRSSWYHCPLGDVQPLCSSESVLTKSLRLEKESKSAVGEICADWLVAVRWLQPVRDSLLPLAVFSEEEMNVAQMSFPLPIRNQFGVVPRACHWCSLQLDHSELDCESPDVFFPFLRPQKFAPNPEKPLNRCPRGTMLLTRCPSHPFWEGPCQFAVLFVLGCTKEFVREGKCEAGESFVCHTMQCKYMQIYAHICRLGRWEACCEGGHELLRSPTAWRVRGHLPVLCWYLQSKT